MIDILSTLNMKEKSTSKRNEYVYKCPFDVNMYLRKYLTSRMHCHKSISSQKAQLYFQMSEAAGTASDVLLVVLGGVILSERLIFRASANPSSPRGRWRSQLQLGYAKRD